jgi:hypothetical protein
MPMGTVSAVHLFVTVCILVTVVDVLLKVHLPSADPFPLLLFTLSF